jgi:maltooligosyltrehalose trehalohydrolase
MTQKADQFPMTTRKRPIGAELIPGTGVHFRVWAPGHQKVSVVLETRQTCVSKEDINWELIPETNGYFSGLISPAKAGTLYRYRIDESDALLSDPASRFQPEGPSGPSEVIDPSSFNWNDTDWPGISLEGQVIYEMHVGTFTAQGSFKSACQKIPLLAETGITSIEIMPVADFPGRFNWGYDGVNLFAPSHIYGRPDDFRSLVDLCHSLGIGVLLDVVYNHIGPVGNHLKKFSTLYFTDKYKNDWGEAINFDGPGSDPVREFFIANAGYWISEFHLDGLRIDATQQMFDNSEKHILAEISNEVRRAGGNRKTVIIAENETQDTRLVRPQEQGGYGMDGLWNDDFHHSAMVALTGHNEAYYSDYSGNPQEFISSIKWGYLYQGQFYRWQKCRRGTPTFGLKPATFIVYIQNHDQIANSARGLRVNKLTSPGLYRAITALLLLAPGTPMVFQGQEFASSSPFYFFSDISSELADSIHKSRIKFLEQFRSLALPEMQALIPRPDDPETFYRSKINWDERQKHQEAYTLFADLLRLRRSDPVFRSQTPGRMDGAVIGHHSFLLRFFGHEGDDRLLVINMDRDYHFNPAPEPLLAPPLDKCWQIIWSSEDPVYGGSGTPPLEYDDNWKIPGQSALVMKPVDTG